MKNIVIYPGTFDPITYGHIDLVGRAVKLFDRLIVAVADNPMKSTLFTQKERIALVQSVFQSFSTVEVIGFSGLMTDFAKQQQANIVLRGLRVVSDFDYEFQMASVNRSLMPELETVFLTPADQYTYISSSIVREVASKKGDISKFVPPIVSQVLVKKFK